MKPLLLAISLLTDVHRARIAESFDLLYVPDPRRARIRVGSTWRRRPCGAHDRLRRPDGAGDGRDAPTGAGVCTGAGFENIDRIHAQTRGIVVANGAGTNEDSVADHALALLLAAVRAILRNDRALPGRHLARYAAAAPRRLRTGGWGFWGWAPSA